ncbi:hypothetical protein NC653_008206 [Populus alba x Populus x berolinensis]|uniref:ABC transmembrane type-1 domain-containing protein n=1 Tax=Populus alba x Populus x berolinensis TaxID=444605 RepID=A0AAD6R5W7_9ROSI|nr:hypothetical protein NC653_008206 [Populus alba x Populus x berolinensis]
MGRRRHSAGVIMNYTAWSLVLQLFLAIGILFKTEESSEWFLPEEKLRLPKISNGFLAGVYTGISKSSTPFVYLRSLFAALLGLKASKAFFSGISISLFKAPMLFFDSTPGGRIYTRVSSDMSALDFDLPLGIAFPAASRIGLRAIIAVMASVTWPVVVVAIPAITDAIYAQGIKAPILNLASETSPGVVTIRAFNIMDMFFKKDTSEPDSALGCPSSCSTTRQTLTRFVGLSLSYALTLNTIQVIMTRYHCNSSNYIVSVERIKQFMHIPPESPATVEDMRPPPSWPPHGRI